MSLVAMRQRGARTLPMAFAQEDDAIHAIRTHVAAGTTIHADSAKHWDVLHAHYPMKRVNHRQAFAQNGACTNQAESFFSRARRSEIGVHHHIAGPHLEAYGMALAWMEDHRRVPNGTIYDLILGACLGHPVSRLWKGYWQKAASRRPVGAAEAKLKLHREIRERVAAVRRDRASGQPVTVAEVAHRIRKVRERADRQRRTGHSTVKSTRSSLKKPMRPFLLEKIRNQQELLTLKDLTFQFMAERGQDATSLSTFGRMLKQINKFLRHQCALGVLRLKRSGRSEGWEFVQ